MESFWAFVVRMSNGVGEKLIIQTVFFLVLLAGGLLIKWWRQRKYGLLLVVRMCWAEMSPQGDVELVDEYVIGGNSLDMLGTKSLAKILIGAQKNTKDGAMMKAQSWTPADAAKVLQQINNQVAAKHPGSTLGRALEDANLTVKSFVSGVFKRSKNEVSVILIRVDHAQKIVEGPSVIGDTEEMSEVAQLFIHQQKSGDFIFKKKLAR